MYMDMYACMYIYVMCVIMCRCIQLAACGAKEMLPMNPDLPADLFTSCLTTPIKTALQWCVEYCM